MSWTNSLFIPRIEFAITKNALKHYFEIERPTGTVSRVDFVSFNSEQGVGRRAFVHFDTFTDQALKEKLLSEGKVETNMHGCNVRLVINEHPVPETKLNLNQVAHNTEFISDQVKTQQATIEALTDRIRVLETEHEGFKQHVEYYLQMLVNSTMVPVMTHIPPPPMYLPPMMQMDPMLQGEPQPQPQQQQQQS